MIPRFLKNLSGFQRVLTALFLGLVVGVFVGEPAGQLKTVGNVYIRLLQMTVLPYVFVSIISGLARLDASIAKKLGIRAAMVMLFLWLITMLTLALTPLAFPQWETAGFFSSSLITESPSFDFVKLFVPSNIFHSLSNTVVPAVVLFCLLFGAALINVPNKDTLLDLSANVSDGLMKVASFVTRLAPIGVFAISASAAGTLFPDELGRLQVYLWVYIIAWFLLALIALPLVIQWATPFTYKEFMRASGEILITAIATGTVLVVLPMIAERCKELIKQHQMDNDETSSAVDVLVPTSYSFPSVGSIMGLGFILFSGWYIGSPLDLGQYPSFIVMGVLSAFGGMTVSLPFMLDFFSMPADQFQLYLLGTVVWGRSSMGLAALHGIVVSLLVAAAIMGHLKWRRMFAALGLHLSLSAAIMIGAGLAITKLIPYEYTGDKTFEALRLYGKEAPIENVKSIPPLAVVDQTRSRLNVIGQRGSIRVGYFSDSLPFAFPNDLGQVVGLDMEMVHAMGNDMGLNIELMRIVEVENIPQLLNDGHLDLVVGGIGVTPGRAYHVLFTDPYSFHSIGFVVPDAKRDEYSSIANISAQEGLRIGVRDVPYYKQALSELLPNAELVDIRSAGDYIRSVENYFHRNYGTVDAYVGSAEASAAWTLLSPEFSVVIPKELNIRIPMGLMVPKGEIDLAYFLNTWLKIKKEDGFLQSIYNNWILGKNPEEIKHRWSIMRDVLGWEF